MAAVVEILSWILLVAGGCFVIVGTLGVLRLPDMFARMHGAGITDTLGAGLVLGGLMLQAGPTLVAVKLAIILLFLLLTSPVSTHALARAALADGARPQVVEEATGAPPEREEGGASS
jgi:multicomponent Na+:H+ antiporter subunit G